MARSSEKLNSIDTIQPHNNNNGILEITTLQKQLHKTEKAKKRLEAALRKKESDLARSKAQLALQQKPSAIWGIGDDD